MTRVVANDSPYAIEVADLSKAFARGRKHGYSSVKSWIVERLTGRAGGAARLVPEPQSASSSTGAVLPTAQHVLAAHQVWALKDFSLKVPRGASCGVIGRNGSGKSTLLKLITGIYRPTAGTIAVRGRVAALIELGAGFHPDFTGRENLHLSAVMLGLTPQEIEERFDDIVDFAEVRESIDRPVRTYSSGMFMRLGFSIAVHTQPDVLLVDEVLSVGDVGFVRKCQERLAQLKAAGTTMLIVSHDLPGVERWSDEVIWVHEGQIRDRGEPRRVIETYKRFFERQSRSELQEAGEATAQEAVSARPTAYLEKRWGSREIEIAEVQVTEEVLASDPVRVRARYVARDISALKDVIFGFALTNHEEGVVCGTNTAMLGLRVGELPNEGWIEITLPRCSLMPGRYGVEVACHRSDGYPYDHRRCVVTFSVAGPGNFVGAYAPEIAFRFPGDEESDLLFEESYESAAVGGAR